MQFKNIKKHFKEVLATKTSPHSIALGAAIGTLIGTLPIPFIDFFIGLFIILIFERINKYALFASILVWNPFTKIPIYTLSYEIGNYFFSNDTIITVNISMWDNVYSYTRRFILGNLVISIVLTVLTYLIMYGIVFLIRRRKVTDSK